MTSLLPLNSTDLERSLETVYLDPANMPLPPRTILDPDQCPAALLPWLAWSLSVDTWDESWSEETKREVVRTSIEVHRHKGTVASVKQALRSAGYGDAMLVERFGLKLYNATIPRDGSQARQPQDHWAEYRVILARPISIAQAEVVRTICASVAPARCRLKALEYLRALSIYDATVPRDGSYSRGVA